MHTETRIINSTAFTHFVPGRALGLLQLISFFFLCTFNTFAQSTPSVALSATNLVFATPNSLSTVKTQVVTLTNTGTGTLSISGITAGGNYAQTNTCGISLAAAARCTISIGFSPSGTATQTGAVTITDNAAGSPHVINLVGPVPNLAPNAAVAVSAQNSGTGQLGTKAVDGVIAGYPGNFTYEWATNGQLTGWIQLTWSSPVQISQVVLYDRPNLSDNIQAGTLQFSDGSTINVGTLSNDGQGYPVTFAPKTAAWVKFTITQAVGNNTGLAEFQVFGSIGPVVSLSATNLNFQSQIVATTSAPQTVTLTSNGTSPVTFTGITTTGDYAETDNCNGITLAVGSTCTINVTFTPTTTGTRTGTITITDNALGSPQTINLTGTGAVLTAPSITTQPANQTVTAGQTATFSVLAAGTMPLGYQWQKNGVNITAANAATYTTPATTTADSASTFQAVVTNTAGTITSSPATLTVNPASPGIGLSTTSLTYANQVVGTTSAVQTVTVTSNGSSALVLSGVAVSGDYAETDTCGGSTGITLQVGSTCTISVTFTPTTTGTRAGAVTIKDNVTGSPQTITLTGTGLAIGSPSVSLSANNVVFATPNSLSTVKTQVVTLTNTGTGTLSISGITASGNFSQTNSCGTSLGTSSSCTISIGFSPSGTATQTGAVTITDNAAGSPHVINLVGPVPNLAPNATVAVSSQSSGTGQQGTKAVDGVVAGYPANATYEWATNGQLTGWIQLTWSSPVQISQVAVYDRVNLIDNIQAGNLQFSDGSTISIGALSSDGQGYPVAFVPKSVTWVKFNITQAVGNSAGLAEFQVFGPVGPAVSLSASGLTYPAQVVATSSTAQTVTLTSVGTTGVTVSGVTTSADYSETDSCNGITLAVGSTCTINVTFTPTTTGIRAGTLFISDNGLASPQTVALTGTGVLPAPAITTQPANQTVVVGQTATFSAVATGLTPLNYQWQQNGINITGANAASYTTPATVLADSGSTFQVVVTNTAGTITSSPATLTVSSTPLFPGVLTHHNDNGRTGQNTAEITLTPANVNQTQFGKKFSQPVDGHVYAQPLYVPNVTIPGLGTHNVVYVATEADSVFAFDADNNTGTNASPLWKASLIDTAHGAAVGATTVSGSTDLGCSDLVPQVGITGTPTIDPTAGTMYVEAKSKENGVFVHRLHAIDITTGAEKSPGPVVITGSARGTATDASGGVLTFNPLHEHSRPGLLLSNGTIYMAFASHCDWQPYHGWIFAYDAATFTQKGVLVTSPNGYESGIWMSGAGIAADASGNIFVVTGNGNFDAINIPANDLGDSILRVALKAGQLSLIDYFTVYNQAALNNADIDLGSGGVLLLPDQSGSHPHELLEAGKGGTIYVVDRDQMTVNNLHYCATSCTSDPQIVQELPNAVGGMWSMPAYWNNMVYFWGQSDVLRAFSLTNGLLSTTPISTSATAASGFGSTPSVSSNGATGGILWSVYQTTSGSMVLYAFDAANVANKFYDSTQAANSRDKGGNWVKFTVPTVANGKVYVGTQTELDVFGLLP